MSAVLNSFHPKKSQKRSSFDDDRSNTPDNFDNQLQEFGYKPELKREFTFFSAFSFAVSISGVFATIGTTFIYPLQSGGAAGIVWAWLISGFGCMCLAVSIAEIVSAYPTSGGMYYSCSRLFPKKWSPSVCWVDGWLNLFGQIAGIASTDYGAAQMLLSAASMGSDFSYVPTSDQTVGVMAALLVFHGFVNTLPTKWMERISNFYVIFHFGCMISGAIALLAKTHPKHEASYVFTHVESNNGWSPIGFSFLFGFLSVSWTMTDYDATAHIAEEMKDPGRTAPMAITLAMTMTYVLGFMYNIALVFCMGDPQSIMSQSQPVSMIYYNSLGKGGGIFFSVAMFLVSNFVAITALQSGARTLWAQSRDNMVPYFSRWLVKVNKLTGTPILSVWVITVLCIAINLIALGSDTTIEAIFNSCAIAMDWSYVIPIIGKMVFKEFVPGSFNLGKLGLAINVWAFLWTLFVTIIFVMPTSMPVTAPNMNYAVVFFVAVIVFSVSAWYLGCFRYYFGPQDHTQEMQVIDGIVSRPETEENEPNKFMDEEKLG